MKKTALAFTQDRNQIGTPWHIVELMSDITGADRKRVLDPTAGNGNLLAHAQERYGIEYDTRAYDMLTERYPDSMGHFVNGDCFEFADWIKEQNIEAVLMNPPFNAPGDKTKGMKFVLWAADTVGSGVLAAILPTGAFGYTPKELKECKRSLMERHTVESIISLNSDTFYPSVTVATCLMVVRIGEPQDNKPVWFADFSQDGLAKDRTRGLVDTQNTWQDTKQLWLRLLKERPEHEAKNADNLPPCCNKTVSPEEAWLPSQAMPHKIEQPTYEDFYKTVRDYMEWKIKQVGFADFIKQNPELLPSKEQQIKDLEQCIAKAQAVLQRLKNGSA